MRIAALTAWIVAAAAVLLPAARAAEVPMRLPGGVQPLAYRLALDVDPDRPTHRGEVAIDLRLAQPTRVLRLHARGLRIEAASLAIGGRRLAATAKQVDAERIEVALARPAPAGRGVLRLAFSGQVAEAEVYGLFRQKEDGRWYAFTQFEPTAARRAFPLFDEPGFKVPWTLTLTVPAALTAVSNMPVRQERAAGGGRKRVAFEPSPPMPSYLLAFGVGPFSVLEAGRAGQRGVPLRFVTPRGREQEAAYAASVTARIVERLEAYFGMPYPYAKLDALVLPVTLSFGAMEHPGLVTYASRLLLATPAEATPGFQRGYVSVAAHELAHQWFGNLVTMAWWDDLWLNESFASWMGDRITDEVMPQWQWATSTQRARSWAMRNDRLLSARRIQQPVTGDDDIGNLFDSIAYSKGQTVLAMFEAWMGAERFREGVRRYMRRHAWGNATGEQFIAALSDGDAALEQAFRSFIRQPGIPLVRAQLQCAEGAPPRLALAQARLLPLGSQPTAAEREQRWAVPMVLRTPGGTTRTLLPATGASVALPDAGCPAWVQANAGGQGYYRVAYAPGTPQPLLALPEPATGEVMAGLDDAAGLAEAGEVAAGTELQLLQRFAARPERRIVEIVVRRLGELAPLVAPAQQAGYEALWQHWLGERGRALGWLPRAGESEDDTLLRGTLLPALVRHGRDASLAGQARTLARAWLADRGTLDASVREGVLVAAALDGDAALFDELLAALRASGQRNEREDLFAALASFRDPALAERARDLLLDTRLDVREAFWPMMSSFNAQPALRSAALAWMPAHHAALAERLGPDLPAVLPELFDRACSREEAARIDEVFAPHAARYPGGARTLAQTLETVRLCSAYAERQAPALAAALAVP